MDASRAGADRRRCVPAAIPLVPVAGLDRARIALAIVDDFRFGRGTRRGWLVDGFVRPRRSRERVAIPPGVSPYSCLRDLCGDPLDRAAIAAADAGRRADTAAD